MNTQQENILILGLLAVMEAIGSVAFVCGVTGIELMELGLLTAAGFIAGLSGLLFGIFLLFNFLHEEHKKR